MILDNELKTAMLNFKKKFGYMPPLKMIPPQVDNEDLIKNIIICINNENDNLLEIYGVEEITKKLY